MPISGVCAVFAESEVINQLSQGVAPGGHHAGRDRSRWSGRSVQLMKRVRMEPEFTLVGGILRFTTLVEVIRRELKAPVNVPEGDFVQFIAAYGAAVLGLRHQAKLAAGEGAARD